MSFASAHAGTLALVAIPPALGVVLAVVWRSSSGRPPAGRGIHFRHVVLLYGAALLAMAPSVDPALATSLHIHPGVALVVAPFVIVGAWFAINRDVLLRLSRLGVVLCIAGACLNVAVIGVNGRMPFSPAAARAAGVAAASHRAAARLVRNEPASRGTRLEALGDIVPVRPIHKVVSLGDLFLSAGIVVLVSRLVGSARGVLEVSPTRA